MWAGEDNAKQKDAAVKLQVVQLTDIQEVTSINIYEWEIKVELNTQMLVVVQYCCSKMDGLTCGM